MKKRNIVDEIKKISGAKIQSNRIPLEGALEITEKRGFRGLSINDQRLCNYGKNCSYSTGNNHYN
jgi:hypothetical protein